MATASPKDPFGPALESLWQQVTRRWQDDSAHDAFLELAQQTGRLGFAAACYRSASSDHLRRERAEQQLAAVKALALAQLERSRASRPRGARSRRVLTAAVVLMVVALLVILLRLVAG